MGYVLALLIGSSLVILGYHRDHSIPLSELLPSQSKQLLLACCIGLIVDWSAFHFLEAPTVSLAEAGLSLTMYIIVIAPAFWMHPLRRQIGYKLVTAFRN